MCIISLFKNNGMHMCLVFWLSRFTVNIYKPTASMGIILTTCFRARLYVNVLPSYSCLNYQWRSYFIDKQSTMFTISHIHRLALKDVYFTLISTEFYKFTIFETSTLSKITYVFALWNIDWLTCWAVGAFMQGLSSHAALGFKRVAV